MPFKLSKDLLDDLATICSAIEAQYSPDVVLASGREYLMTRAGCHDCSGNCSGTCSGSCVGDCTGTCRGCTGHACGLVQ